MCLDQYLHREFNQVIVIYQRITKMSKIDQWKTVEYRKQLVLNLNNAGKALIPFIHGKQKPILDGTLMEVVDVCNALEAILLHGVKLREWQGMIPLWGLLERLEVLTPPCTVASQRLPVEVFSSPNVYTEDRQILVCRDDRLYCLRY